MKRFVSILLVIVSLFAISIPAMADTATGKYNTKAVALRPSAGSSTSYGNVSKNATCNILDSKTVSGKLWYKVYITSHTLNSPDLYHYTGWSMAKFIDVTSGTVPGSGTGGGSNNVYVPSNLSNARTGRVATINGSLNLRNEPNGQIISTLAKNLLITYYRCATGHSGTGWLYVVNGSKKGWVSTRFIVDTEQKCTVCGSSLSKTTVSQYCNKTVQLYHTHSDGSTQLCTLKKMRDIDTYTCNSCGITIDDSGSYYGIWTCNGSHDIWSSSYD